MNEQQKRLVKKNYKVVFYVYLLDRLVNNCSPTKTIAVRDARKLLFRSHNIPKNLTIVVLKEMEFAGLLKFINSDLIKLNSRSAKAIDNTSKVYKEVGLW